MIGKISASPSFSSKVILKGFGTGDYKNIKMNGYNHKYEEYTKQSIKDLRENGENDIVTLSYNDARGYMSLALDKTIDSDHYSSGPIYFLPNGHCIERVYERAKRELTIDED